MQFSQEVIYSFYTFLGAFVLYILNRINNKQPFSLLLAINLPINKSSKPHIILFDMLVSSIIGALVVVPLVEPHTTGQCIMSGLGMTGLFSVYSKEISHGK